MYINKCTSASETLASLGIMGTNLKPLNTIISAMIFGGFQRTLNWAPMMPRDVSLSESCKPDRCSFSSLKKKLLL